MKRMGIRGVIVDVDGTLVLSNDAHAQAWAEALAEQGYVIPAARIRPLIGMGGDKILPELVPGLNDEEGAGKQIAERRSAIFLERYAPKLRPTSGVRALVKHMQDTGIKVVVASSAKQEELAALLRAAQVDDLVPEATTSSDAEESKPAPDIVEAALNKLGLEPSQVLMVGDTPDDIESADACGIGVVAVRCGGFSDAQLKGAVAIYADPADLLRQYDTSPLG
jgi:HAD superfamily hydrolase (TIGR01509 family)